MKNHSTYSDFLKHENEITKLKIQAEFGLEFNGENNLNPAIENIWLNQILEFERSMANHNQVKIIEKLGNPVFKPVAEIEDKNIVIDSVAGVDDREMYRFITEELVNEEVAVESPANMLTCYIYEEFHPNDEYDIKNQVSNLMNALQGESKELSLDWFLSAASDSETDEIRFSSLKRKLSLFKNAFDKIESKFFEYEKINIEADSATVIFKFDLSVLPAESKKSYSLRGAGKIKLMKQYEWWSIVEIEMPGVV